VIRQQDCELPINTSAGGCHPSTTTRRCKRTRPTAQALRGEAVEVVCILEPNQFFAVGLYYEHFEPVSDDAVRELLAEGIRSVRVDA
jgi:hypothetical protein